MKGFKITTIPMIQCTEQKSFNELVPYVSY